MIITVIFPQKIIHRGLCQNWIAQSLEHMVQILCEECGESGRMPLWRSSADCQRLPDPSKCLVLSAFTSLCLGLLFSLCSLNFPFMPLITRKASFSTCCVSALWTESGEFTNGAGRGYMCILTWKPKSDHSNEGTFVQILCNCMRHLAMATVSPTVDVGQHDMILDM